MFDIIRTAAFVIVTFAWPLIASIVAAITL